MKYVLQLTINVFFRGIPALLSFFLIFLTSRLLDPNSLDELVLTYTYASIFGVLISFGLFDFIVKNQTSPESNVRRTLHLITPFIIILMVFISLPPIFFMKYWFISIGASYGVSRVISGYLLGQDKYNSFQFIYPLSLGLPYFISIMYMVLVDIRVDISMLLGCASVISSISISIIFFVFIKKDFTRVAGYRRAFIDIYQLLSLSRYEYFRSLIGVVISTVDVLFLSFFTAPGVVGSYGIISRAVNLITLVKEVVVHKNLRSIYFELNQFNSIDRPATFFNQHARTYQICTFFLLTISLSSFIWVEILVNNSPANYYYVGLILAVSHICFFLIGPVEHYLIGLDKSSYLFKYTFVSAIFFCISVYIMSTIESVVLVAIAVAIGRNIPVLLSSIYLRSVGFTISYFGRLKYE